MKIRIILNSVAITVAALILSGYSYVLAQTPATSSAIMNPVPVISDYAKDVQDGKQATANDVDAQNNQRGAKENENTQGKEEVETVETQETIEPQEAVEPSEAIEPAESEGGQSDLKSEGSSSDSKVESGSKQNGNNQKNDSHSSDKENNSTNGY